MGSVSYTAHVSNGKSAITSKGKIRGVANHNLRKYRSSDYSRENILLLHGTNNLYKDVQDIYHREFDEAVGKYNEKQKRIERRIGNYFDYIEDKNKDMAVEIIVQIGDKEFWENLEHSKDDIKAIFSAWLEELQKTIPGFKVANAVVHFDEASPHMHIVGVPVAKGYKNGPEVQVAKRNVFTPQVLSEKLQGTLREKAETGVSICYGEKLKEKKKGRNNDLTVTEYKVKKEREKLLNLIANAAEEKAYKEELEDYIEEKESEIARLNDEIKNGKNLVEVLKKQQDEQLSDNLGRILEMEKEIDEATGNYEKIISDVKKAEAFLQQIRSFVSSFKLFAPTIEEYSTAVETEKRIEAGNSFSGILSELGRLLQAFKEFLKEGLCWFPRLMRWKTSVGEVAPVFMEKNNGCDYILHSYMNVETKIRYTKESIQCEIQADKRVGTVEQMDANMVAMEKDIMEILRINAEQKRLWEAYERR